MKTFFLLAGFGLSTIAVRAQSTGPLVVAADGSGQFRTVQAAIDAAPSQSAAPVVIQLKKGTYHEKVAVPSLKTHLVLRGDDAAGTIITYDDHVGIKDLTTPASYSVLVQANDFTAENVTFENTAGYKAGQAVALNVEGDRAIFRHCRLVGNQDVLLLATGGSRQYYRDCYIEGTTDFIFGASTGVFDHCVIKSKKNSFVTAASTPAEQPYGLVFLNCKLVADTALAKKVYLGRPWRPNAKVVYINCELGSHIVPAGWDNWKNAENEKTAYFAEYHSTGPGARPGARVPWSHQLTAKEAKEYSLKNIFSGMEPWVVKK
ncbi:pectinesterase family protein [Hymenobacter sp. BRD67]|uniref:pectinesterase family protein n=1 Tax=Hymenobacter sp. BRD67 TaxID=2675877 RepID=UPI00156571CD|nr:pectinesterase family protein [Hymenobacter sp. BRD67]QKG52294.1 pectin esterase [Hymenobacter sp. BRD67]